MSTNSIHDNNNNNENKIIYPFRGMIFEGGGSLGVAHVGAVKVFNDLGILDQIEYFVGSSAGAIIATMLACRADPNKLTSILMSTDFNKFKDDSYGIVRDVSRFIMNYGWYKGDALETWYGEILKSLTGSPHITFQEAFAKFGTHLTITVTDVNLGKTLYLNHQTSPDMMIKRAIRRSSIMPLLFRADNEIIDTKILDGGEVKIEKIKHYFTDGGLLDNYPIHYLDNILEKHQVVGFRLMSSLQLAEIKIPDLDGTPNPPQNVVDYILLLCTILRNQALKLHVNESDWERTVKIDVKDMSSTNFNLSNNEKQFLIEQGISAAKQFINTSFNNNSDVTSLLDKIDDTVKSSYSTSSVSSISSILSDGSFRKRSKKHSFRRNFFNEKNNKTIFLQPIAETNTPIPDGCCDSAESSSSSSKYYSSSGSSGSNDDAGGNKQRKIIRRRIKKPKTKKSKSEIIKRTRQSI